MILRPSFVSIALIATLLSACSGSDNDPHVETGFLVDGPISGVTYRSGSVTGTTESDGRFFYEPGKPVSFAIGDLPLGTVTGAALVTPFELVGDTERKGTRASINLLRFLQSIDSDNNLDNGITIPAKAATALKGQTLDFSQPMEGRLDGLVKTIAGGDRELRDDWSAWLHAKTQLALRGINLPSASENVKAKIIAFNDFHGNLDVPMSYILAGDPKDSSKTVRVPAGGVAYFASLVQQLKSENAHNVVVSAGDMTGASPLTSALFADEPTIEAMNRIGVDINAVGNHEFDQGYQELLRLQYGGCDKHGAATPCGGNDGKFAGANFRYLAANVSYADSGKTLFPSVATKVFNGIPVAFIGMTLEGTPTIVTPAGVAGLKFAKEPDTVNALIPQLRQQGIEAFVVVIHQGGATTGLYNDKSCPNLTGDIKTVLDQLDPAVDIVVSGHTHNAYNCIYKNVLLTSAASYGRLITDIDIELDPSTHDIVKKTAENRIVASPAYGTTTTVDGFPVLAKTDSLDQLVSHYKELAAPLQDRAVGKITATITRTSNDAGESALGDVIADAQLAATAAPEFGGAQIAMMNPGGIRADLNFVGDGTVTYGNLFTVQPFGNSLVVMTLTGAQLKTVLEQQWSASGAKILQISSSLNYTYDNNAPIGSKLMSITVNGNPVDPSGHYRVTVNSFMATGGDGFLELNNGSDRLGGALDVDAFEAYLKSHSPLSPATLLNRITRLN